MSAPGTPPPPQPGPGEQEPGPHARWPHSEAQTTAGYPAMPGVPAYLAPSQQTGQLGRLRPTGMTILLVLVTFGIWAFVYYFQVHEEMRRHSGQGLGGIWALVISLIFGVVSPFLLSNEVGQLYQRRGQQPPVTALTALWWFPGMLILVGPFIWFVRTNNALNEYWEGLGVRETTLV